MRAIQLTSGENVNQAIHQTTTCNGLRVVCEIANKRYDAGVKALPGFLANEPTIRDKNLAAYIYKFSPN